MSAAWPDNPVLVEVVRSGFLESAHRGVLVALGPDGAERTALGAVDRPVLPRSSNKPLQATAMLDAGWRPAAGEDLALAAASHSGEDAHRARVTAVLAAAGLGPDDLGCPPDLPLHEPSRAAWTAAGRPPERVAMNCSGKHAGMLSACVAAGWPTEGYLDPDHPLQQRIRARLEQLAGEPVTAVVVDGCGAPQHALTPRGLARGVLSLVRAEPGTTERAVADAARAHPWWLAGTGRPDTGLMEAVPGLLVKAGAEGVFVAAHPELGAVVLKLDDGGDRGRALALAAGLRSIGVPSEALAPWLQVPVLGGGRVVGEVLPAAALAS